jgi:hypothetical protein
MPSAAGNTRGTAKRAFLCEPFFVSAAKAVLFAGAGVGRDEITHTERWPVVGFTGYRHACASLLEYLLVHIH